MSWKDVGSRRGNEDNAMSTAQRMEIIRLREKHDRVSPGSYAGDKLPPWDKLQASREIERLQGKIEARDRDKIKYPCQLCWMKVQHTRTERCGA